MRSIVVCSIEKQFCEQCFSMPSNKNYHAKASNNQIRTELEDKRLENGEKSRPIKKLTKKSTKC